MAIAKLPHATATEVAPFQMDNPIFDPDQFGAMMQVASVMSEMKLVPDHLQGKPADCFLVVEQARRWEMSPFAVAQETYSVKGKLLFGGKLVTAVVNTRAPVKAPLAFDYEGEGDKCRVTVSATLRGEDAPRTYSITVGEAKAVAGSSSLWRTDPKQQVAYFAARFWARRHCPETLLGVWGEDEVDDVPPMRDVTPAPTARDTARASAPAQLAYLFDYYGEEVALTPGEVEGRVRDWCRDATDEQLEALVGNNPGSDLVAGLVRDEQSARTQAPDPDPLGLLRVKGAMAFMSALRAGLERSEAADADRYWVLYRDRAKAAEEKLQAGEYGALERLVAEKITGVG
jgi:hypothetical protein